MKPAECTSVSLMNITQRPESVIYLEPVYAATLPSIDVALAKQGEALCVHKHLGLGGWHVNLFFDLRVGSLRTQL